MAKSKIKLHIFTEKEFKNYARFRMIFIVITLLACGFYLGQRYNKEVHKAVIFTAVIDLTGKINPPAIPKPIRRVAKL